MRITTLQSMVLGHLRGVHEQCRLSSPAASLPACVATNRIHTRPSVARRFASRMRSAAASVADLIASCFRVAGLARGHASIGDSGTIRLRARAVIRLAEDSRVEQIEVVRGAIRITAAPAAGDILLQAGRCFRLPRHGPVVIQALEDSEIILRHREPTLRGVHLRL